MNDQGRYTNIPTKMLPIEDIGTLLKLQHGFADLNALGVADFNELAISADDRETVKNAYHLKGQNGETLDVEDIATKAEQEKFLAYMKEIKDIKDELYQFKAELGRKGLIQNAGVYSGFQENFNKEDIVYDNEVIAELEENPQSNSFIKLKFGYENIHVGDYLSVGVDGSEPAIVKVVEKLQNNELRIETDQSVLGFLAETAKIKRSSGFYFRNSYAFVNNTSDTAGQEAYTSFADNRDKLDIAIRSENEGVGLDFVFPQLLLDEKETGYLSTLEVFLRKVGTPGSLIAYVIPLDSLDPTSPMRFEGFSEADLEAITHYKSKPLALTTDIKETADSEFKLAKFDFSNELGQFQKIDLTRKYLFVIKGYADIDALNYYRLRLVRNGDREVETINKLYKYRKDFYSEAITVNTDVIGDVYYRLGVKDLIEESVVSHARGVYTKTFEIANHTEAKAFRATMRINREGFFKFAEDMFAINGVEFEPDGTVFYSPLEIRNIGAGTHKVIVGTNIQDVVSEGSKTIKFRDTFLIQEGDELHRLGYKVLLRPMYVEKALENGKVIENIVTVGDVIEVPPVAVIKDRVKREKRVSNRIIFEEEIPEDEEYNRYQVQIVWDTGFPSIPEKYSEDFYGAIQDLTVSMERKL